MRRPRSAPSNLRRCIALVLAAGLLAALTASCGGGGERDLDARVRAEVLVQAKAAKARGWTEQAQALSDGVLTDAEVDSLHSLYRECMAQTDAVLSPAHRSPIDGRTWIEWETNVDQLTEADIDPTWRCQTRFDVSLAATLRPKAMDEPLRHSVQRCLRAAGVETDDADRDVQEIYRRAGEADVGRLGDCITDGMAALYPEIEAVNWGPPSVY